MGRGQNSNINQSVEETDSNPPGWLWGVQDLSGGSNCRCGGDSKKLESEVEPEYMTELLQSHDKTFNGWEVASYGWANNVVSWDGISSWWRFCEDCWNDNKGFIGHYINTMDTEAAVFERIGSNFKRNSSVSKMLSNSIAS